MSRFRSSAWMCGADGFAWNTQWMRTLQSVCDIVKGFKFLDSTRYNADGIEVSYVCLPTVVRFAPVGALLTAHLLRK